jgi:superoxide reductase
MSNRRDFLKASLGVAAGVSVAHIGVVSANSSMLPPGLIYTKENPGKWDKKVKSHLPMVKVEGNKVTVETKHGMTEKHYIVRHTLVSESGEVLAEKTFSPDDEAAVSVFELPSGKTAMYATSFCNKHDMWVAEISA